MLSLAIVTFSPRSLAISSSAGAIIRHGPHHSAQKSTRTGPSAPSTSEAKLWSVTVLVAMAANLRCQKLTNIWAVRSRLSRRHVEQLRSGRIEQRCADLPIGKNDSKRGGVRVHLCAVGSGDHAFAFGYPACLEIEHGHAVVLNEQAVSGAGDNTPVRECRCERRFAERSRPEQRRES